MYFNFGIYLACYSNKIRCSPFSLLMLPSVCFCSWVRTQMGILGASGEQCCVNLADARPSCVHCCCLDWPHVRARPPWWGVMAAAIQQDSNQEHLQRNLDENRNTSPKESASVLKLKTRAKERPGRMDVIQIDINRTKHYSGTVND